MIALRNHLGALIVLLFLFAALSNLGDPNRSLASQPVPPGLIRLETEVPRDSVTVGERVRISYRFFYPDSLEAIPFSRFSGGNCTVLSMKWKEEKVRGEKLARADVTVFTLDLKEARLPRSRMLFRTPSGDTLFGFTDDVSIPVRYLAEEGGDIKPLKSQWQAPRSWFWPVLLSIVALLAALGFYLWRRRTRAGVRVEEARPELPADFLALRELSRIEAMKLLETGEFKRYYTLLVDALRRYLERRFGFAAMDLTTDEILDTLSSLGTSVTGLTVILREADLVKFAKLKPGVVPGRRAMEMARRIVAETAEEREEALSKRNAAGSS